MDGYTPSTVPGCRTPHLWCGDGTSLYDQLGPEFTLLRLDAAVDVGPLLAAARVKGVPLTVVDLKRGDAAACYDRNLVLSRPDQHVAWRGDRAPENPAALIDRIRGVTD